MIAAARWLIVVIALAGVALDVMVLDGVTRAARLGVDSTRSVDARHFERLTEVEPGSSAERAGLRAGDVVRFATPADESLDDAAAGGALVRVVRTDGSVVAMRLGIVPLRLQNELFLVLGILMALFALLLALRAWPDVQARWLAVGFVWIAFFSAPDAAASAWSVPLNAIADVAISIGMAALVFFATGWSATPSRARMLRRIAIPIAALYLATTLTSDLGARRDLFVVQTALWCALAGSIIGGLATSMAHARGIERRRIGWILVTMTVTFGPWIVFEIAVAAGVAQRAWGWLGFSTLALPFGFGYAMLRHRVVDLGFALNRAAVFAATTALLIGLFGALQWGADQVLVQATRAQGFAVQMAIAVIVLYAVRFLRTRADALVARLFFAKRQRRIDAIRALGRAIEAVESPASLAPYVVGQLQADTAIESSLYVEGDDAFVRAAGERGPAQVSRDNPTVIALRATGAPVAIRAESDLIGAIAFPLAVRGRLRGALVCELPSQDEDFAPDERQALTDLAARVCVVREDLLAEQLRAELGETRAALSRLTGATMLPGRATSPFVVE